MASSRTDPHVYQAEKQKLIERIKAAMILTAAGLAQDAEWYAEDMRKLTTTRIDIPYNPAVRPIHAFGGTGGFFKEFVHTLLARWTLSAPPPADADEVWCEHGWDLIYFDGPGRSVSAHQVLEANALLTETLIELGHSADKAAGMLELRQP